MQQVQRRELPERISWARALIFAVGFFFLSAILLGQLPGYIYLKMTASTLEGFEIGALGLAVVCLGCFAVIMTIVMLFDPKPVVNPRIFTGLGGILALVGLAISIGAPLTGYSRFPHEDTNILPLLGGKFLWFQPNNIDFLMIGLMFLGVGLAMVFYSILAIGEQKNPDRRDLGVTTGVRLMLISAVLLLMIFVVGYSYIGGVVAHIVLNIILGAAIFLALGAFALRLHYLMRPVRKNTMSGLYAVGMLGLAHIGAIFLLLWLIAYPLIAGLQSVPGLGAYLTICSNPNQVPASCYFSPDAGYLADAIVASGFFTLFLAAIWAWKSHRSLVVISSVVITAVIGISSILMHTDEESMTTALMITAAILILAGIWTIVARREFAVLGENNLGCLGMWLVFGTCLFVYLACFALFSYLHFGEAETPPNIPVAVGAGGGGAFVMLVLFGILGAIQFYFLVRNRYRV